MTKFRIRLRLSIAATFVVVVVPLTLLLIGILFRQNVVLAREMADRAMFTAGREVAAAVTGKIDGLSSAIEASVAFGRAQMDDLRKQETLRPLMEQLKSLPEVEGIYFGMQSDGEFFQVAKLEGIGAFGPKKLKPPPEAKWALRTIESSSGERRDTYLYLEDWNKVVRVERGDPAYDPRGREWYKDALGAAKVVCSDVMIFASTGRPGLILSRRLATADGLVVGVFGASLSVAALGDFLRERVVGRSGITFIMDEKGRLLGYPDSSKSVVQADGKPTLVTGEAVAEPAVAAAAQAHKAGAGDSFSVEVGGSTYLARFTSFGEGLGKNWVIGIVVPEDDFIGPLRRASYRILMAGLAFILLAAAAILWLARFLTRPITQVIAETERIREFQLDGTVDVRSRIWEIDALAKAVGSMKSALSSFGTYVPKSLVQGIVRSGSGTGVGGQRQPVTVMFTDLRGFTETSEGMDPEQVLHWLSAYFERMSQAIHAHQGTIDKFIGDAVMALWNAPLPDPDHVANACRGALACRRAVRDQAVDEGLETRFGLHTGQAMVGNVGSSDRLQYTALGSMVNLASRVEGLNKYFGTDILVTGAVADAVGDRFRLRPFGPVLVVGASMPLEVFELLDEDEEEGRRLEAWMTAWKAWLGQDWSTALAAFAGYAEAYPRDLASKVFMEQAWRFSETGTPPDWDGVMRFTGK